MSRFFKPQILSFCFIVGAATTLGAQESEPVPEEPTAPAVVDGVLAPVEDGQSAEDGQPVVEGQDETPPLPDVDEVMARLDNLWRAESSHMELSMSITTEHWSRTLEIEGWSRGEELSVMIIRSPAREAGTATLRTEEGLWNYAPRADRLMRIPTGLLSDSWMGSHFTNDDLMRDSGYDDDFDTVMSWEEEDGRLMLKADMTPHPEVPIVYSQVIFYMDYEALTPVRAEYYDDGELLRSFIFSDVREINGTPVPWRMDVIPHDKPGEGTFIQYSTLELDVPVDDGLFTQRGLRRAAQRR